MQADFFVCLVFVNQTYLSAYQILKNLCDFFLGGAGEAQLDLGSLLVICMSSQWLVCSYAYSGYYLTCEDYSYVSVETRSYSSQIIFLSFAFAF